MSRLIECYKTRVSVQNMPATTEIILPAGAQFISGYRVIPMVYGLAGVPDGGPTGHFNLFTDDGLTRINDVVHQAHNAFKAIYASYLDRRFATKMPRLIPTKLALHTNKVTINYFNAMPLTNNGLFPAYDVMFVVELTD
jgi:hypothetical protein